MADATTPSPTVVPASARRPPPRRGHPVARGLGAAVGWSVLALAATGLLLRELDTSAQLLVVLTAAAYVVAPLAVVALGLALWRRAWVAVAAAVAVVAVQVVAYGPVFVAQTAPASGTPVRVLTQNLLYGTADAEALVARVRAERVDVLAAQELTPRAVARLRAAGLSDVLPHEVTDPRRDATGTGIWSRWPLADTVRLVPRGVPGVGGHVTLPDGQTLQLWSVHPSSPWPGSNLAWYAQLGRLPAVLRGDGPSLAAGDYNATLDHARFRALLTGGWRDGAEQAGAGWLRTWPSNRSVPDLVGIDHVLTRSAVATSVVPVYAPGSDHRGLLATVVVPRV